VIGAPMAGGVSTPELVAAVTDAGGLGFLAGGYLSPERLAADIEAVRALTPGPFGVNLFVPGTPAGTAEAAAVARYRAALEPEARRFGLTLPEAPPADDDGWAEKLNVVAAARVPVVSVTFGCPTGAEIARLHAAGCAVVGTVTGLAEARLAVVAGADALCVQGAEAGGHRGRFLPKDAPDRLADLLPAVRATVTVPLIAAGGLMDGADLAAVRAAGAVAGQFGTALLRTIEAGTAAPYRDALAAADRDTTITTAFTGRPARGLVNRFIRDYDAAAPDAYPRVHHLTRPVRAASVAAGDAEAMALWAGTGYRRGREIGAAALVRALGTELVAAERP